ncbi:hypothetical protein MCOR25_001359 [Pyricularia grisea]|uniref:Peptidase A1 domain-containing protein n=1 Tax=Pyricularia grisea TaxID=148305 RepID=A0A6P8B3F7_PYRGI|nr:uncharacterized protein PgNI_07592 [Pyricularia grisea]KAI6381060.1 hypothetical protein MCOR25_001359 [Pyricularia grisea]TLD09228.1 hypothetical protein PgNI_07592 [Pyricularia grisea]
MLAIYLACLALWVTSSRAFFPWIPCEDNNSCEDQQSRRRSLESDGVVTFPISVRASNNEAVQSHGESISRIARYLSAKYSQAASSGNDEQHEGSDLTKRQNNRYTISRAQDPKAANSIPLNQDGTDFSYFVDVGLGSGPKQMLMLLDTGAGTTWIMGSTCKSSPCTVHNTFGPDDSSTFKAVAKSFSISYGSGSVSGSLAQDTLSLAGKKIPMTIGIANVTSDHFNHFPFDGILGLSMASGATDNLLQTLKKEKAFKSNVMGVYVNRNSDGPNMGEVTFGGTDSSKYTGDITYTTVPDNAGGVWAIPMGDLSYDGKKAGISGRRAYIDTGTTYIFGPPGDVSAIHKQIPGAKSSDGVTYTAPCNSNKSLTVSFSGTSYTIFTGDWLQAPNSDGECVSNLYGNEVVKGSWLLGSTFLKNVYAVFDMDQTRIGFGPRSVPPQVTSTTSASGTPAATSAPLTHGPTTPEATGVASPATGGTSTSSTGSARPSSNQPQSPAQRIYSCPYMLAASFLIAVTTASGLSG